MNFLIETLGCKVNEYESRCYASALEAAGFEKAESDQEADVLIINSCTVTNTAAAKSRQRIAKLRRMNPGARIVLAGCYAQSLSEKERAALEVDVLVGASHKNQLVSLIQQALQEGQKVDAVEEADRFDTFETLQLPDFAGRQRAFLKVEDGCNQFCSYCAIPYVRGRERSMGFEQAIEQAKALEAQGYQEIVLTGIHTGRYTSDSRSLADLLAALLENTGEHVKYRISSIEITEVSEALTDLMKSSKRILPHLHIPIQSACNATLQRMHRPYTVEEYEQRLTEIRREIPEISVSTDVICGFVQESEEEFAQTLENLKRLRFSFLHVFPYSKRDNTAAAQMPGHLNGTIIKERAKKLLDLSEKLRQEDMLRFEEIEILPERKTSRGWTGYTAQYHPVLIESSQPLKERFVSGYDTIENGKYCIVRKGKGK